MVKQEVGRGGEVETVIMFVQAGWGSRQRGGGLTEAWGQGWDP